MVNYMSDKIPFNNKFNFNNFSFFFLILYVQEYLDKDFIFYLNQ